jgi:hypothetical protein
MTTYATVLFERYDPRRYGWSTMYVPVLADTAVKVAISVADALPAVRNVVVRDTAPSLGYHATVSPDFCDGSPDDVPMFVAPYAAWSVICPKCKASGGQSCQSTGGGNPMDVATHKTRTGRVAGWTNRVQDHAAQLVRAVGLHSYYLAGLFAAFEDAAAPIPAKPTKALTAKGVKLSERQAEFIEYAVQGTEDPGLLYCPTGHLDGDHEIRKTINALEEKGILVEAGRSPSSERLMRLTPFGWQVYRQHRLIIRRLDEAEVDRRETVVAEPKANA